MAVAASDGAGFVAGRNRADRELRRPTLQNAVFAGSEHIVGEGLQRFGAEGFGAVVAGGAVEEILEAACRLQNPDPVHDLIGNGVGGRPGGMLRV